MMLPGYELDDVGKQQSHVISLNVQRSGGLLVSHPIESFELPSVDPLIEVGLSKG